MKRNGKLGLPVQRLAKAPFQKTMRGRPKNGYILYYKILLCVKYKIQDIVVLGVFFFVKSLFEFSPDSEIASNDGDNTDQENGVVFLNHAIGDKEYPGYASNRNQELLFSRACFHGHHEGSA
jgi:hypothetical protein